MAKTKYIIISYFPLLEGRAGDNFDQDRIDEVTNRLDKLSPFSNAEGCLWGLENDSPHPIFIMKRGDEIYEHLILWGEGKPEDWFELHIAHWESRYAIGLIPKLDLSVERFKDAQKLINNIEIKGLRKKIPGILGARL